MILKSLSFLFNAYINMRDIHAVLKTVTRICEAVPCSSIHDVIAAKHSSRFTLSAVNFNSSY